MDLLNICLSGLAGILALFTGIKWKTMGWTGRASLIVSTAVLIIGIIMNLKSLSKEAMVEKITATYGNLSSPEGSKFPTIGVGFEGPSYIKYYDPGTFELAGKQLATMYTKDGKLYFSTVIRDFTGEPVLAIYRNEWTKYSDDYEFNNDENGIELVTKGDRVVFFHMKFEDGIVFMEGCIWTEDRKGINICGLVEDGHWNAIQILGPDALVNNRKLKRLFKYPRERYLGVREDQD